MKVLSNPGDQSVPTGTHLKDVIRNGIEYIFLFLNKGES